MATEDAKQQKIDGGAVVVLALWAVKFWLGSLVI